MNQAQFLFCFAFLWNLVFFLFELFKRTVFRQYCKWCTMCQSFCQSLASLKLYMICLWLLEHIRANINDGDLNFFEYLVTIQKSVDWLQVGLSDGILIEKFLLTEWVHGVWWKAVWWWWWRLHCNFVELFLNCFVENDLNGWINLLWRILTLVRKLLISFCFLFFILALLNNYTFLKFILFWGYDFFIIDHEKWVYAWNPLQILFG